MSDNKLSLSPSISLSVAYSVRHENKFDYLDFGLNFSIKKYNLLNTINNNKYKKNWNE